jgi:hypothetical protein
MQVWGPVLAGVVLQLLIAAFFYGRFSGSVTTQLKGVDKTITEHKADTDNRFGEVRAEQDKQWTKINAATTDVAVIKERLNIPRANGHAG